MHTLKTLPNGLRVVITPLKDTKSVTVLCLVGAGSRYETKDINGISHYLEHLFFKGAERYKNAMQVSTAIDAVGGDFNAFTGKEYVGYYVKLGADDKEVAFDVIGDMMLNATFLPEEVEKERGVIMEEYNMYQDTPMYQVGWDFERLLFGDQPMGWDQIGTKETINALSRDQFVNFKNALYTPENAVISVAGNVTEEEVMQLVEKYFSFPEAKKEFGMNDYIPNNSAGKVILQHKKTEQAHMIIGVEALPAEHEDEYVEKVLSVILGGGMSSRMFSHVREQKGLAYYIRTSTDNYLDTGVLSTSAGINLDKVDSAVTAIMEEYRKMTEEKVTEEELNKAKGYLKGKIVLRIEDSEELAHLMGKQELLYKKVESIDDILKKIEAVSSDDVLRLSQQLLKEEAMHLALIGPYEDKDRFANLLHY